LDRFWRRVARIGLEYAPRGANLVKAYWAVVQLSEKWGLLGGEVKPWHSQAFLNRRSMVAAVMGRDR